MSSYKRPSLPPPEELAKRTASLRERLDAHAKFEGVTLHRPVNARDLAKNIRSINEARERRQEMSEEQQWAKEELLIACKAMRDAVQHERDGGNANGFHDSVGTLVQGMAEFLESLGKAKDSEARRDALKVMRESIASLDRYRGAP